MKFYIVTPTFNALTWLQQCIRSVADQIGEGVEVHHHVQDGCSNDGTRNFLEHWQSAHANVPGYTFTFNSAKDSGMYDALNISWSHIPVDATITAHLNSDEQYFPGALKAVAELLTAKPETDIILASFIIINANNRYICHKRPILPRKWISNASCEIPTCACFHKVETFIKHGIRFDARFRAIADKELYRHIVNYGVRFALLPRVFSSAFTVTGTNLAWMDASKKDCILLYKEHPELGTWYSRNLPYRYSALKRYIKDKFYPAPKSYSLYSPNHDQRTKYTIERPTTRWGVRQA